MNTPVAGSVSAIDTWVTRVELAITSEPNPRRRQESITKLKNEYHQNVLGVQDKSGESQM